MICEFEFGLSNRTLTSCWACCWPETKGPSSPWWAMRPCNSDRPAAVASLTPSISLSPPEAGLRAWAV